MYIPEWVVFVVVVVWAISVLKNVDGKTLSTWLKAITKIGLIWLVFYLVITFVPDWFLKLVGAVAMLNFLWNLITRSDD